ncbi:unnamed protein product [Meganyctiphanes norvegica]|uniref:Protein sleepless n=1 Tax=Meganyctiphanes norvegica TaxID=48144 RepID=A0AAV2RSX4_MEGNR
MKPLLLWIVVFLTFISIGLIEATQQKNGSTTANTRPSIIQGGRSLKCYIGMDTDSKVDEVQLYQACTTTTMTDGDGETRVLKSGHAFKVDKGCNTINPNSNPTITTCNCLTDLCNTAVTSAAFLLPLLVLLALTSIVL